MSTAALVGWSGNGDLDDLHRTAASKLALRRQAVGRSGRSLIVENDDPVAVARRLAHLPGVDWIAVGYAFEGRGALTAHLRFLAGRYLKEGSTFRLDAQVERSGQEEGDVLLDGNGSVLKAVKGTRVDERRPDVTFRIVMAADRGVVGVQLKKGPGGVPTSRKVKVFCLVSGGYHSAVVAWLAVLSGYSVTLVHSRADDESLRQAARLYAELSRRADAGSISLEVLEGDGSPGGRVAAWLEGKKGATLVGVHPECRGLEVAKKFRAYPLVSLPLLLLQEDEVRSKLDRLGLRRKDLDAKADLSLTAKSPAYVVKSYGGKESDINGVLDGILR